MNTLTENFHKLTLNNDEFFAIIKMASKEYNVDLIEKMTREVNSDDEMTSWISCILAEDGHRELVDLYNDDVAFHAARGGHTPIVNDAIFAGCDNYKLIIRGAAEGGHLETVLVMITAGIHNYYDLNTVALAAAKGGHIHVVEAMIERGANNLVDIALCAKEYGYDELLNYIKSVNYQKVCSLVRANVDSN